MNASLPYGAVFPPETWLPIQLEFVNRSGRDIQGWGVWPVESKEVSADFEVPVTVPAHSQVKVWAYGYVPAQTRGGKEWGQVKPGEPLATIQWREQSGAWLARVPVLGIASWASGKEATGDTAHPGWVFLQINAGEPGSEPAPEDQPSRPSAAANDADSLQDLCTQLSGLLNEPILSAMIPAQSAPRSDAGYAACRFVLLGEGNPDHLDAAQRQALLRFVRAGGNLVVAAPRARDQVSESWIAPYLPVELVGYRLNNRIEERGHAKNPLKLLGYVRMAEAVASHEGADRSHVIVRDEHYVHAAWRALGQGRIIFTSFPVAALDTHDKRAGAIWQRLLNTQVPATHWQSTALHSQRVELVAGRLGKPTASWTAAAILAGGFVLLVLAAQLAFTGARRPGAFAVAVGVAVVVSVALVGWTMVRTGRQSLMGSSLSVMEIAPEGGGHQREVTAYVGKDSNDFSIRAARDGVLIRPIVSGDNRPIVREKPFAVPAAQVRALRVERVWQSDGSAPADLKASATARFGEKGLTLSIDNQTGQTLLSPLWLWGRAIFSLNDLQDGPAQVIPDRRNGQGDYTNAAVIRSQIAQWRGQVVQALHTPMESGAMGRRSTVGPEIDAWLTRPPALTQADGATMRSEGMVRLPVRIEPSPAGSTVKIDAAYTRLMTGGTGVAQYDPLSGRWLATNLDTSFQVGFAAPAEIGRLEPVRVNLDFDINAPQQTLTIRRGQVRNGKLVRDGNPNGEVVGEWTHPVERHQVSFAVEPSDYDAQGRLWLRVEVHSPQSAGGNIVSQWQFRYLEAGMTAKVK